MRVQNLDGFDLDIFFIHSLKMGDTHKKFFRGHFLIGNKESALPNKTDILRISAIGCIKQKTKHLKTACMLWLWVSLERERARLWCLRFLPCSTSTQSKRINSAQAQACASDLLLQHSML
ncbi:hypothetical protein [Helicobacter ailurogastricus]|uniref:hypothetical protein n=1 Tax=Helicobacter ailurogastricus TaxID=1578720 RepID=UPI0018D199EF|nr:hypothetical protein [Helicobacter ailurogastricus]